MSETWLDNITKRPDQAKGKDTFFAYVHWRVQSSWRFKVQRGSQADESGLIRYKASFKNCRPYSSQTQKHVIIGSRLKNTKVTLQLSLNIVKKKYLELFFLPGCTLQPLWKPPAFIGDLPLQRVTSEIIIRDRVIRLNLENMTYEADSQRSLGAFKLVRKLKDSGQKSQKKLNKMKGVKGWNPKWLRGTVRSRRHQSFEPSKSGRRKKYSLFDKGCMT